MCRYNSKYSDALNLRLALRDLLHRHGVSSNPMVSNGWILARLLGLLSYNGEIFIDDDVKDAISMIEDLEKRMYFDRDERIPEEERITAIIRDAVEDLRAAGVSESQILAAGASLREAVLQAPTP